MARRKPMKNQKKNKEYPLTPVLSNLNREYFALKHAEEILSKPRGLLRRIDAEALIVVSKYCERVHQVFWETARQVYPDLKDKDAMVKKGGKEIIVL